VHSREGVAVAALYDWRGTEFGFAATLREIAG
jgi:hypothetical protein